MDAAGVLVRASCPDPKRVKAGFAPFHIAADGVTTTSASGFIVLHGQQPLVVTSAALLLPLVRQQRRESGLGAATAADLVPGARLHVVLQHPRGIKCGSSSAAGVNTRDATPGDAPTCSVELRLLGLAELSGVRSGLLDLLAAPSLAGPFGWQLGWLLHDWRRAQGSTAAAAAAAQQSTRSSRSLASSGFHRPPASISDVTALLEAACHVAVLVPTAAVGTAALRAAAWTSLAALDGSDSLPSCSKALRLGQPLMAVGAPFGALAPEHFSSFVSTGVLSAVVPAGGSRRLAGSDGAAASTAALLLSDMRCCPGMEGGPVFAADKFLEVRAVAMEQVCPSAVHAAIRSGSGPQAALVGMLLPPLKAPAAAVEFALVAPLSAMAMAVSQLSQHMGVVSSGSSGLTAGSSSSSSRGGPQAGVVQATSRPPEQAAVAARAALAMTSALVQPLPDAGPLADALSSVVAISVGGAWASGVIVSSAGHILTNAHLLPQEPQAAAAVSQPDRSARLALRLRPAAAPALRVLLPSAGASSTAGGTAWEPADLLYVFEGPLDLAVLLLRGSCPRRGGPPIDTLEACGWRAAKLAQQAPRPGTRACVAGFPAFNPRGSPLASPIVTAGHMAKVLRLPGSGGPAMLLTTAAVHSGASGGAVLDAATGQLLGLVTSNAKHTPSNGQGGIGGAGAAGSAATVLPHLNFSIPAAQLASIVAAAQAAAEGSRAGGLAAQAMGPAAAENAAAAALAAWRAIDAAASDSAELRQVWRLDQQRRPQCQEKDRPQQQQPSEQGRSKQLHVPLPPAKLQALMLELEQQQQRSRL